MSVRTRKCPFSAVTQHELGDPAQIVRRRENVSWARRGSQITRLVTWHLGQRRETARSGDGTSVSLSDAVGGLVHITNKNAEAA